MPTTFSRSMRSLAVDSSRRSMWGLFLIAVLLGVVVMWFFLVEVTLYEITPTTRLEVSRAVHPIEARIGGRVAATHVVLAEEVAVGDLLATVIRVASEPQGSQASSLSHSGVRVELAIDADSTSMIPLEHGLPRTVEVEVEQVSPAMLVLRAAGKMLHPPPPENLDRQAASN